jgi:N-acetylmuramoyl-L-alanine amidase
MYLATMLLVRSQTAAVLGVLIAAVGCAPARTGAPGGADRNAIPVPSDEPPARGRLPDVPEARGPLLLRVVYPDTTSRIAVRDSSFIFGSTGDGEAQLTIDGVSVRVAPNGTWLAWVPFRGDSVVALQLVAHTGSDTARLTWRLRRARRFEPPAGASVWIDTTSFAPRGRVTWPADESLSLSVRAKHDAALTLVLPDGARVPLSPDIRTEPVADGIRGFGLDTAQLETRGLVARHRGVLRGVTLGDADSLRATLEAVTGLDTIRIRWPLSLTRLPGAPVIVELDDDPSGRGGTDGITVGRAAPGATYHWFFPAGTQARVTGRVNDDLRIALSSTATAWVPAAETHEVAAADPSPAIVGSIWMRRATDRTVVRIPLGARRPFQIVEGEREINLVLYGAVSDINWTRYGVDDDLVRSASWSQTSADQVEIRFVLSQPVWGYRTRWQGADLMLEIRRPPAIDSASPLRGRTIVVDAGHPPAGATGVSGLTEAEANLGVAEVLRALLERDGARVVMTRTDARPVDLWPRVRFADSVNADLLLSIHNNALPDGVNPFLSHGSSVFYNQPRSIPLARAIQRRLVARFGTRDLGIARGDLALVRPTWMPAVLTEGLFMMVPEQEAALRSEQGRLDYALAVLEGVREFLRSRVP